MNLYKTYNSLLAQSRSVFPAFGLILLVSFLFSMAVLLLHWELDIPIGHLTRDPALVVHIPIYIGAFSIVGILFWFSSTAICLFSATLVSPRKQRSLRQFLLVSGLFTLLLVLDDLFLLHEEVFPKYVGIPERVVEASYGILMLLYLLKFRAVIFKTEFLLFGLALGLFGFSLGLDVLPQDIYFRHLLEDGSKFAGIVTWLAYFARVSYSGIKSSLKN
jgi:hypothetical protein